jgi:hypothetical protein
VEKAKTLRNLIPDEAELVRIINFCRIFIRRVIKEQKAKRTVFLEKQKSPKKQKP